MPDNQVYKMYYDEEKTKEVKDLQFPIVDAGSVKDVRFYIENTIEVPVNFDMSLTGEFTDLVSYPRTLKPKEVGQIVIRASPKLTILKAPLVNMKITPSWVI